MSDKNNNLFSDDVLKDLEALKSRYSDSGDDNEPIKKPVRSAARPQTDVKPESREIRKEKKPAAPAAKEKSAEAAPKKAPAAKKPVPAEKRPAPAEKKPVSAEKKPAPAAKRSAPAAKAAPSARPAKPAAPAAKAAPMAADDELSVFDGLILTDNGKSSFENEKPVRASKPKHKAAEKSASAKKASDLPKAEEIAKPVNKKKKNKKKARKIRNIILIAFIALVLWGTIFAVDLVFVSNWQDPIFCKKTAEYENGSKDFVGAFYKVQYHVDDNGDIYTVCLPWFVKGPNADFKEADSNSDESDTIAEEVNAAPVETDNTPIEITIPSEFMEEDTSAGIELTAEQKQRGYISASVNGDGSVTYQINKSDYDREVETIKLDVKTKLQNLANDTDYPSIKKVEFDDEFSTVSMYVDKAVYTTGLDSFASVSVYSWVGYYQSFAQKSLVCDLTIYDYADNSVIEQSRG